MSGYGNNVGGSYDCNNYNNVGGAYNRRNCKMDFVLLVVLFILLIIVGAHFCKHDY